MTAGEAFRLSAASGPVEPDESTDVLKRLQESALDLLAGLDRAPRSLRIRTDQVEIELEWADEVPAPVVAGLSVVPSVPSASAVSASASEEEGSTRRYVTAQTVGVFYRAPEPGAKPYVDVGDLIAPGRQVGLVEAMKLMMPVESEVDGRVVEILVADGASVEYGDRLLAYEPADHS